MRRNVLMLLLLCSFLILFLHRNIIQISNNIAVVEFNKGKIYSAIKIIKKTLKYAAKKEKILQYNLANANYKIFNYEEARQMYLKLLKDEKVNNELKSEIYYNLGNIECMHENYASALENYYMALLLNSNDKDIKFNIELIEYINRPVIYNEEVLAFPKQKIKEQIQIISDRDIMEEKLSNDILNSVTNNKNEYFNVLKNIEIKQKYTAEISAVEYGKLLAGSDLLNSKFNQTSEQFLNNKCKMIEKAHSDIKKILFEMNLSVNELEQFKYSILNKNLFDKNKTEQKHILKKMTEKLFNKNKNGYVELYDFINKNDENTELLIRELFQKINQMQYDCSIDNYNKVISKIEIIFDWFEKYNKNFTKKDKNYLNKQFNLMIKTVVNAYLKRQISNYDEINRMAKHIKNTEYNLSRALEKTNLDNFIKKLDSKIVKNVDYNTYLLLQNKIGVYKYEIYNFYLLYDNLMEQNRYNMINIENLKHIVKSKSALMPTIQCLYDAYDIIDAVFKNSLQYILTLKQQKQMYKEILSEYKNKTDLILKLFSNSFCLHNLQINKRDLNNSKKSFNQLLILLNDKENSIKEKKNKKAELELDIKINQGKMTGSSKKDSEKLQKEIILKQKMLKNNELLLLRDVKSFISVLIKNLFGEVEKTKKNIVEIDNLFQKVINISENEKENIKFEFSIDKIDLGAEIIKFEKEKKYIVDKEIKNNIFSDAHTQNIIGKALFQREKLNVLLDNEKKVALQLDKFKKIRTTLMQAGKSELNNLEEDLTDKQLTLIKYYLSIDDDEIKKDLVRKTMQSLYKIKYKEEQENIKADSDDGNKFDGFTKVRRDIFNIYKSHMYQLRELNKLIYRMKITNTILELEYILKLKDKIEFSKKQRYPGVGDMIKELNNIVKINIKNRIFELSKVSLDSKEHIKFADNIRNEIINYQNKQKNIENDIYSEESKAIERKLYLLNEKLEVLKEISDLGDDDYSDYVEKEIDSANKGKLALNTTLNHLNEQFNKVKYDLNLINNMTYIVKVSNLMIDNIKSDSNKKQLASWQQQTFDDSSNLSFDTAKQSKDLTKTDIDRILYSYSSLEKAIIDKKIKNKQKKEVENDW